MGLTWKEASRTLLYTIYPPETVLGPQTEEKRNYLTLELDGKTLVLELRDGQAHIARLISTDPKDYLKPEFQPGERFHFPCPG